MMLDLGRLILDIVSKIRLTFALIKDSRISIWLKMIPFFSLFYLILPLDLLLGPIDDAVIIYLGMDLFISLCPRDIVDQLMRQIRMRDEASSEKDVIDVEFKEN